MARLDNWDNLDLLMVAHTNTPQVESAAKLLTIQGVAGAADLSNRPQTAGGVSCTVPVNLPVSQTNAEMNQRVQIGCGCRAQKDTQGKRPVERAQRGESKGCKADFIKQLLL